MKKLTKQAITLLSTAVLSMSALAQDPVEIRFSWWGGNTRHTQTLEAIKAFEAKHPDIKIKAEYGGWGGYLTKVTTQIAGRTEPDVMQLNWSWLDIFSPKGNGFYDINTLKNIDLKGYSEQNLSPTLRNGKLHAMTASMSGWTFYYNKNTWEKAGLEYPETWDQLINAGQVFKEKLGDDYYPLNISDKEVIIFLQSQLIQKYGVALVDPDKKKIAYNAEQLEEMFNGYKTLVDNHVIPSTKFKNSFGNGNPETLKPWINGQWAGAYPAQATSNELEKFLADGQTLELGKPIQNENATESGAYYRPSMVFSIGKTSKHPEEAAMFLNFMLHDQGAMDILTDVRGIPFSQASANYLRDKGAIKKDSLNYEGFQLLESLTYTTQISPYIENEKMNKEFVSTIEKMDYENLSPEKAAKEFRRKADRILRKAIKS